MVNGDLAVRIDTTGANGASRHLTQYVTGLSWTKVAPGGHQGLSFNLNVPNSGTGALFDSLGPQDRAYVYDSRTGDTVIDGYLTNPTPVNGPAGQSWDISATSGMGLAADETRPLIYLSRDLTLFDKSIDSAESSTVDAGGPWNVNAAYSRVRNQLTPGQPLAPGSQVAAEVVAFEGTGISVGAVRAYIVSGRLDLGYQTVLYTNGTAVLIGNQTPAMDTAAIDDTRWVGADIPAGTTYISLALERIGGATNVASDDVWTDFVDVYVLGQRMDRYGTLLTGSTGLVSATQVLASQVVEDLLGRLLTMCNPATAQVDPTAFAIDQLAYLDGATAADVLNALTDYEPDYLWEVLQTGADGRHGFSWRRWPTTLRYTVSTADGWRQTGSDSDLCNRIAVAYTDPAGKQQTTVVTAADAYAAGLMPLETYQSVTDALGSRIRDAEPVTLPEGHGSAGNAFQVAAGILNDAAKPPLAGTVTVDGPILDQLTGALVMPWELEAGYLCRVRELGVDLRVTQVTYTDEDRPTAALTLGTPPLTSDQRTARLSRAA